MWHKMLQTTNLPTLGNILTCPRRSISSVQRGKFCFTCDKKSIFKRSQREQFYKDSFAATLRFSSSDRLTIGRCSCSSGITGRLLSLVRYESHLKLKVSSFEKKSRIVRTWHWETRGSSAVTCKWCSAGCLSFFPLALLSAPHHNPIYFSVFQMSLSCPTNLTMELYR